jgi:hypothetical protein
MSILGEGFLCNQLDQRRLLVLGAVHHRGYRMSRHLFPRKGPNKFEQFIRRLIGRQPFWVVIRRQNHRHTIMQGLHEFVGLGRDNGTRLNHLSFLWLPVFPKPSESKRFLVLHVNEVRLLAPVQLLPFVEAVASPAIRLGHIFRTWGQIIVVLGVSLNPLFGYSQGDPCPFNAAHDLPCATTPAGASSILIT